MQRRSSPHGSQSAVEVQHYGSIVPEQAGMDASDTQHLLDPVTSNVETPEKEVSCWEDYREYLENVDAVSWYLIQDEEKVKAYTRFERFCVGVYAFMVHVAMGTCIRSLNTCENTATGSGLLDAFIASSIFAFISEVYEFFFLVPLFKYILSLDYNDSGMFQKYGFSGPFCNCFIWFPISLFFLTSIGFMTGDQGPAPECKYILFSGKWHWGGLLTGLWMFFLSSFVTGVAPSRI